jgi:tetratricopeptide (TPR) repeat protein
MDRSHRYHLATVLYGLGRVDEARPYFEQLAREFPDRLQYRGLAAVASARGGDFEGAERWLGVAAPREAGDLLAFRARIAAIRGDTERAIVLLTQAADHGIVGYPWIPSTAYRDVRPLLQDPRGRALLTGR